MRSLIPVAVVLVLGLLACRHGDGYAGDGFGPALTPSLGSDNRKDGDGDALGFDSGSASGSASGSETMKNENAHMRVRAYKDRGATEMAADWEDEMFFYEDPPRLIVVGRRGPGKDGWTYSEPHGQTLKVHSDKEGKSGKTLAEWAPESAVYIVVRIVPLARKHELEQLTDGEVIEMEAEVITAGDAPQKRDDAQGDEQSPPSGSPPDQEHDQSSDKPPNARPDPSPDPSSRDSATSSEQGLTGAENDTNQGTALEKRPGDPTGVADGVINHGAPEGHRHGMSREDGGVKADGSITGIKHGAAQGGPGGSGDQSTNGVASGGAIEIFGLVIGGVINVPPALKPAIDVASILGQNLSAGGLFKRFAKLAGKKAVPALRTELASAMRTDIDKQLKDSIITINADKTLTKAEKQALIRRTRHLAGRAYFDMVEQGARAEVKRLTDELNKLKGKRDKVSKHHRQLRKEQLDAAQKLEKAAKVKPINAKLSRRHEFAGGKMPLPERLHAKYGTDLPFTEDGFPDFSKFVRKEVKIKVQGKRTVDDRSANIAAGLESKPTGWSWHHHHDGTTMQLVPSDLHNVIGHNGSYSIYRAERGLK